MKTVMAFPAGRGSFAGVAFVTSVAFVVTIWMASLALFLHVPVSEAFVTPTRSRTATSAGQRHQAQRKHQSASTRYPWAFGIQSSSSRLHFFGRGEKESAPPENSSDDKDKKDLPDESSSKKPGFFSSLLNRNTPTPPPSSQESESQSRSPSSTTTATVEPVTAATTTTTTTAPPSSPPPPPAKKEEEMTPMERAQMLRAQAEKARLEAERMDAELTLQKITRLEKELAQERAKKKKRLAEKDDNDDDDEDDSNNKAVQELQREMEALQARLRGETPKPNPPATSSKSSTLDPGTKTTATTKSSASASSSESASVTAWGEPKYAATVTPIPGNMSQKELDRFVDTWKDLPDFVKKTMAASVFMATDSSNTTLSIADVNATEVFIRTDRLSRLDYSFLSIPKPTFTKSQIEKTKAMLQDDGMENWFISNGLDPRLGKAVKTNETEAALLWLEYNYYADKVDSEMSENILQTIMEDEWFGGIINEFNKTAVDNTVETLYPKCTRKEAPTTKDKDQASTAKKEALVPTMAQVQQFTSQVLPKAFFASTAKPEPVAGGYVIRGKITNDKKITNGDDLIRVIDEQLAKTGLADKMTVVYAEDFTLFADLDRAFDAAADRSDSNDGKMISINVIENELDDEDRPPILYVMGPDICREPRKVLLSITTAAGLATSWYLSIYPFLLNPALAKRVDEQLALADANMTPDLAWLTDLSLPLFTTFVVIMLCHEAGHRVVAAVNGIKPTFPTFVPSIITGVTSTVTSFKEPPKNKQAMFDFSSAGPLFGMLASIAALTIGSQLTLISDPGVLPALPLEILRQSSLGGGIINGILGNGVLNVPEGALGTAAVAGMTIPLHPVAVAGYLGLIVNALNVLPIGTTDGGRMALSLFGRGPKLFIGNTFMFAILLIGTLGSDLFLFYFAFCLAFQSGNEIPAKNEVDSVDFSRVIAGTLIYVLALLVLIPI